MNLLTIGDYARAVELPRRMFSDEVIARHVREAPINTQTLATLGELADGPHQMPQTPFQQLAASAAMDWAATGYGLGTHSMTELNPLLRGFKDDPVKTVAGLVAMDLAAVPLLKKLEAAHPKIARWLLPAIAAYRMGLALNNLHLVRTNRGQVKRDR